MLFANDGSACWFLARIHRSPYREWEGERFDDGRPKVSDDMLERLKDISIEEAWGVLRNKGFRNQYEGDWHIINPDEVMTGRVVTAQYMPSRPDLQKQVKEQGNAEERAEKGGTNSWPIDVLEAGCLCGRWLWENCGWHINRG